MEDDRIPLKYIFKQKWFEFVEGREFTEYFHKRPIPEEKFTKLSKKAATKGLGFHEHLLYEEFIRSKYYEKRRNEILKNAIDSKVLYLASGYDGIPSHVFGEENVVMVSKEAPYFNEYKLMKKGSDKSPKIISDMFSNPLSENSFSTILINAFCIFDNRSVQKWNNGKSTNELFAEIKRILKPDGVLIVSEYDNSAETIPGSQLINKETRRELTEQGWKFENEDYTNQISMCVLRLNK